MADGCRGRCIRVQLIDRSRRIDLGEDIFVFAIDRQHVAIEHNFNIGVTALIGLLRDKYSVAAPGGDLLLARSFDEMTADVIDAKDVGRGVIDGVECEVCGRGEESCPGGSGRHG
jgi:hypothetical protein